jgi:insertion element IS1 protein InsB
MRLLVWKVYSDRVYDEPTSLKCPFQNDLGKVSGSEVCGTREDETFLKLKELLAPFGITHFYTDGWGAYRRHLDPAQHTVGKQHTQKIERKHTTLRARIKRLVRKTICFSRSIFMHDLVIGLFINRYEFRYAV